MAACQQRGVSAGPIFFLTLMKKYLAILMTAVLTLGCVGQKEDPEEPGEEPVIPVDPDNPSTDAGRCLVLDFTGTWCVNCPRMEAAIQSAIQSRPGVIVPVSVHCLSLDPMAPLPLSANLSGKFGVSAYPSVVVDLDGTTLFSTTSADLLLSRCDARLKARGQASDISLEVLENGNVLNVTVRATASLPGDYTLHFLVLEDGIVAAQTGGSEDAVHNNVLREWYDSQEFKGVAAGGELSFRGTAAAGPGRRVVAFVCRGGIVDNVTDQ